MDAPTVTSKPCCVCNAANGKHCAKCKSRHYCSKKCQLVDWKQGHNKACNALAIAFQDRLLDELMPEKLKFKEEPAIVDDVAPAAGPNAAARLPTVRTHTTAVVKATAVHGNAADWRGICAICFDVLSLVDGAQKFVECCGKMLCADCGNKCEEYDTRCPLCRTPIPTSNAEWLRRTQKHVDKGHAEAQHVLGSVFKIGGMGIKQNFKRAFQLYQLAAAQGHVPSQKSLGDCYVDGRGVEIDYKTAAHWYRRAADQGHPVAQNNLGNAFSMGKGVAQSYDEAIKWYRLAAAQGDANALYNLGVCHEDGFGVARDFVEARRLFKRAAAKGHAGAAAEVEQLLVRLAARFDRQT